MDRSYTVGRLAAAAGVPTSTVRYYERRGLLRPATRQGSGNYRAYGRDELERLRFIRAAQASGFALEDVAALLALLALRDGRTAPCREVQDLIESRVTDVAKRLNDLARVGRVLKASLKLCRQNERSGRCEVIHTLSAATVPWKSRRRE